jgi:hypothetical protein
VGHDRPQHHGQQDDHYQPASELGGNELPSDQHHQDDSEFDDEIGRGKLEGHRGYEIRPLAEYRSRQRDGGIGTG